MNPNQQTNEGDVECRLKSDELQKLMFARNFTLGSIKSSTGVSKGSAGRFLQIPAHDTKKLFWMHRSTIAKISDGLNLGIIDDMLEFKDAPTQEGAEGSASSAFGFGAYAKMEKQLNEYLQKVVEINQSLHPQGIAAKDIRTPSLPLEETYVELQSAGNRLFDKEGKLVKTESKIKNRFDLQEQETAPISGDISLSYVMNNLGRGVLLGKPGSGKSTCMQFLAYHFAKALKDKPDDGFVRVQAGDDVEYGKLGLPILIRVRDYVRSGVNGIRNYLPKAFSDGPVPEARLKEIFDLALSRGEALILLDGMDEVADVAKHKEVLTEIKTFVDNIKNEGNRVLLTSRIASYSPGRMGTGFSEYTLKPMGDDQIQRFLSKWCIAVETLEHHQLGIAEQKSNGQKEADSLWIEINKSDHVRLIADTPLLLTILAMVHHNNNRLPQRRVEVYSVATETLLKEWRSTQTGRQAKIVTDTMRQKLLEPIAHYMHASSKTATISAGQLREKGIELWAKSKGLDTDHPDVSAFIDEFLECVEIHSGIMISEAVGQYRFFHLTFEEYLAGCHLVTRSDLMHKRITEMRDNPYWREPIRLAIASRTIQDAEALIKQAILEAGEEDNIDFEKLPLERLLLAVLCICDIDGVDDGLQKSLAQSLLELYWETIDKTKDEEEIDDKIRSAFREAALTLCGATAVESALEKLKTRNHAKCVRAIKMLRETANPANPNTYRILKEKLADENEIVRDAGAWYLGSAARSDAELLHELQRLDATSFPGVFPALSLAQPHGIGVSAPEVTLNAIDGSEMIRIPAGGFWRGSDEYESEMPPRWIEMSDYSISKAPITVGQYLKFCDATGHRRPSPPSFNEDWQFEYHPIVNVSWEDAVKYCEWAGGSLPSEAQWEKAARGCDGRKYPWGMDWNAQKCRSSSLKYGDSGGTIDTHSFPDGVSPFGLHDMAGNVWEWCRDSYVEEAYVAALNENPESLKSSERRVLRGGSWDINHPDNFRCSNRTGGVPTNWLVIIGFRLHMSEP